MKLQLTCSLLLKETKGKSFHTFHLLPRSLNKQLNCSSYLRKCLKIFFWKEFSSNFLPSCRKTNWWIIGHLVEWSHWLVVLRNLWMQNRTHQDCILAFQLIQDWQTYFWVGGRCCHQFIWYLFLLNFLAPYHQPLRSNTWKPLS